MDEKVQGILAQEIFDNASRDSTIYQKEYENAWKRKMYGWAGISFPYFWLYGCLIIWSLLFFNN